MSRAKSPPGPTGILVVDKPAGLTSFEVVQRARKLTGADKAGHTGTLDPLATGVLPVCLGEAVKLQQYLTGEDKAYLATVAFGAATETGDAEGRVIERGDAGRLTADAVRAALPGFLGEIEQLPPMYSAVRVRGRRLHEAARAGEEVDRVPRKVRVHAFELKAFEPSPAGLARARLEVRCGKGTYVRSLATELGQSLGVPAHLEALRRTAAGPFTLEQAWPLGELERIGREDRSGLAERIVPVEQSLRFLPALHLSPSQARDLANGCKLIWPDPPGGLSCALDPSGRLLALCEPWPGGVRPVRVFPERRPGPGRAPGSPHNH